MFRVEMTVLQGGERMPLLYRTEPYVPVLLPLVYIAIRRRYQKSRTLLRDVRALRSLYHWCEAVRCSPLDLDSLLLRGSMLSPADFEAYARWLRIGRPPQPTGKVVPSILRVLKPVSLENSLAAIRVYLRWAVQRYRPERGRRAKAEALRAHMLSLSEIFSAVHVSGRTPGLGKGLEPEEMSKVLEIADPKHPENPFRRRLRLRNALILHLLYETGIRRGELLKLKVEDLVQDQDGNCFIHVCRRSDDPSDTRRAEPGQKTDNRILAVHPSLHEIALRYIREQRRPKREGRVMKLAHAFLFVSERGAPLAESEVNYVLARLAERVFGDRSKLHPHLLRNTFCNEFVDHCTTLQDLDEEATKDRLRVLCGWTAGSDMPERYTRKRLQREANAFNLRRQQQARKSLASSTSSTTKAS